MTIYVETDKILKKHELLRKEGRGIALTKEEKAELEEITAYLFDVNKELTELEKKGAKFKEASAIAAQAEKTAKEAIKMDRAFKRADKAAGKAMKANKSVELDKPEKTSKKEGGLCVSERRTKADALIKQYTAQKMGEKEIIQVVARELSVSTTYVYKIIKGKV